MSLRWPWHLSNRIPYFDAWVSNCLRKEDTVLRLARDDQVSSFAAISFSIKFSGITSGPGHCRRCGCQPKGGAGGRWQGASKVEEVSPQDAKVRNINIIWIAPFVVMMILSRGRKIHQFHAKMRQRAVLMMGPFLLLVAAVHSSGYFISAGSLHFSTTWKRGWTSAGTTTCPSGQTSWYLPATQTGLTESRNLTR